MAEHAEEVTSVAIGHESDGGIADCAGNGHDDKKLPQGIIRRPGGGEKHAGRGGDGNRRRSGQSSRAPALEQLEELRQLAFLELLVQISRPGVARHAEREVSPKDGSSRCRRGVFIPRIAGKKRPRAPRWRRVEAKVRVGGRRGVRASWV